MTEFNFDELKEYFLGDFEKADLMHKNREFGFVLRTKGIRSSFHGARYILKRISDEGLKEIMLKQFQGNLKKLKNYNWFYREALERFGTKEIRSIIGHSEAVDSDRYNQSELVFHLTVLTELFSGYIKRKDFFLAYGLKPGACHFRRLLGYIAKFDEKIIRETALKECPFPEATLLFWELLKELYGFTEEEAIKCARNYALKVSGLPHEDLQCWDYVRVTETHPQVRKEYHLLKAMLKDINNCPLAICNSYTDEVFRELAIKYRLEKQITESWQKRLGFKSSYSPVGLLSSAEDQGEEEKAA